MKARVLELRGAEYPPTGGPVVHFAWPSDEVGAYGTPGAAGEAQSAAAIASVASRYSAPQYWTVAQWQVGRTDDGRPVVFCRQRRLNPGEEAPKRHRGRPRIGRPLNLPLHDAQHARLAAVAAQRGLPVAEVARRALDLGLGAMEEAIDPDEARYGTIAG